MGDKIGENYNAEFFERALASFYACETLKVEDFNLETVTPSGANFCSVIHRVALKFRRSPEANLESGNYIIKDLMPEAAELGSSEQLMYDAVLPAMVKVLQRAPTKLIDHKLSADCHLAQVSPGKETYILEDLASLDYVALDRFQGLNLEDAKICLRKTAQFHGASMVLQQENPPLVEQLPPSAYAKGITDPIIKGIHFDATDFAADLFAGELPQISKKMKALIPDAYSRRMQEAVDPNPSAFNVICHGDVWLNNIMINRDTKRAVFFDFQNCFWGSPAVDLHFFFHTSLQQDLLLHRKEELLKHYFEALTETLELCGFTGFMPNFEQLKAEWQRCSFYGFFSAIAELPTCCASAEASKGFNCLSFADSEKMRIRRLLLFENERVRQTVKAILVHFDQQGILEPLKDN
ncbi:hypothetical protein KR054_012624 [Drosophila jambulina]|nr:hypothetical protein KR054_012624 [Drosophila jambulina]